jgi:hypothetical protein
MFFDNYFVESNGIGQALYLIVADATMTAESVNSAD